MRRSISIHTNKPPPHIDNAGGWEPLLHAVAQCPNPGELVALVKPLKRDVEQKPEAITVQYKTH